MRAAKLFLLITTVYFLGFFAHGLLLGKTVYGDGVYYYSWLRSIVVDRDINFTDEYAYFDVTQPMRPNGTPGNKYSIGPALSWAPAFLTVDRILIGQGYELPYQLAVGFTNVSLALVGLLLLYNLLSKRFNDSTTRYTITAIALATNLLFYGAIDPVNTHALTFFAATVLLTLLFEKKPRWHLIGIALGLLGLIRPQDLVYGIFLLPLRVIPAKAGIHGFRIKSGMTVILCFFLTMIPQFVAWRAVYGSFIANPYAIEGQSFNFLAPKIIEVLFSPNNGLFLWTPLLLLGFLGLLLSPKPQTLYPVKLMLLVILLQMYLVASWQFWWQGASFSGRMFVSTLPLFAFGIAHLLETYPKVKYVVPFAACCNAGLILFFLAHT